MSELWRRASYEEVRDAVGGVARTPRRGEHRRSAVARAGPRGAVGDPRPVRPRAGARSGLRGPGIARRPAGVGAPRGDHREPRSRDRRGPQRGRPGGGMHPIDGGGSRGRGVRDRLCASVAWGAPAAHGSVGRVDGDNRASLLRPGGGAPRADPIRSGAIPAGAPAERACGAGRWRPAAGRPRAPDVSHRAGIGGRRRAPGREQSHGRRLRRGRGPGADLESWTAPTTVRRSSAPRARSSRRSARRAAATASSRNPPRSRSTTPGGCRAMCMCSMGATNGSRSSTPKANISRR